MKLQSYLKDSRFGIKLAKDCLLRVPQSGDALTEGVSSGSSD